MEAHQPPNDLAVRLGAHNIRMVMRGKRVVFQPAQRLSYVLGLVSGRVLRRHPLSVIPVLLIELALRLGLGVRDDRDGRVLVRSRFVTFVVLLVRIVVFVVVRSYRVAVSLVVLFV